MLINIRHAVWLGLNVGNWELLRFFTECLALAEYILFTNDLVIAMHGNHAELNNSYVFVIKIQEVVPPFLIFLIKSVFRITVRCKM